MTYSGDAYRAHNPIFAKNPISGEGARLYGGRFNRVGVPALYLSTTYETAIKEAAQSFAHKFEPITLCSYEVECERVLDLTNETIRQQHGITLNSLNCAWSLLAHDGQDVPSWLMADRLIAEGFSGILASSYAPRATQSDKNLILWKWSKEAPNKVQVYDPSGKLEAI